MQTSRQNAFVLFLSGWLSACCSTSDETAPINTAINPPAHGEEHINTRSTSRDASADNQRSNKALEDQLRHILSGQPKADAEKALQSGNNSLWGYNNRSGKVIPGVEGFQAEAIKKRSVQIAPGMGDVVYGKTHQALRRQFIDYASAYNKTVMQAETHRDIAE